MDKDKLIEEILQAIHNMIDVEDVKPQLEALWQSGYEKGYYTCAEDAGIADADD